MLFDSRQPQAVNGIGLERPATHHSSSQWRCHHCLSASRMHEDLCETSKLCLAFTFVHHIPLSQLSPSLVGSKVAQGNSFPVSKSNILPSCRFVLIVNAAAMLLQELVRFSCFCTDGYASFSCTFTTRIY